MKNRSGEIPTDRVVIYSCMNFLIELSHQKMLGENAFLQPERQEQNPDRNLLQNQ